MNIWMLRYLGITPSSVAPHFRLSINYSFVKQYRQSIRILRGQQAYTYPNARHLAISIRSQCTA